MKPKLLLKDSIILGLVGLFIFIICLVSLLTLKVDKIETDTTFDELCISDNGVYISNRDDLMKCIEMFWKNTGIQCFVYTSQNNIDDEAIFCKNYFDEYINQDNAILISKINERIIIIGGVSVDNKITQNLMENLRIDKDEEFGYNLMVSIDNLYLTDSEQKVIGFGILICLSIGLIMCILTLKDLKK